MVFSVRMGWPRESKVASLVSGPLVAMAEGWGLAGTGRPAVPLTAKLVPVPPWALCTLCSPAWNAVPLWRLADRSCFHSLGSGP